MIYLKTADQIESIRKSNEIVALSLDYIKTYIQSGITTLELNTIVEAFILSKNARPAFKGLYGFPAAACISVNDAVVHGIPGSYKLKEGDIVGIDIGVELNGFFGDGARTFEVGVVDATIKKLCSVTEQCLNDGIRQCIPGNRVGDISYAVQLLAESNGFSVVRDLVGHGVGLHPHEDPQVPNYGESGKGARLKEGMVLAIEPMINLGKYQVYVDKDQWTVRTVDRTPSAHFEHSVAITKDGPVVLTRF